MQLVRASYALWSYDLYRQVAIVQYLLCYNFRVLELKDDEEISMCLIVERARFCAWKCARKCAR